MTTTSLTIMEEFAARFGRSRALHERAAAVLPGGLSHDIRRLAPFTVYADRAAGSRKWDVDGHELIDYVMGHGSLLLGHDHPAIVEAIAGKQVRDVIYVPGRLVNIVTSG